VSATLATSGRRADSGAIGEAITPQNYFYVADDLRRELQVAQVVCLDGT
jgi:serine protease Do